MLEQSVRDEAAAAPIYRSQLRVARAAVAFACENSSELLDEVTDGIPALHPLKLALLCSVFVLLLDCQKQQSPTAGSSEPGFTKPTATEVFDLRTKCAELGDKILKLNPVDPSLTREQYSHYDVNTNRCNIDLFVSNGFVRNNDWGNVKWPDYASETVFDGQSREMLASVVHNEGKVTTFINGGPLDATEAEAYARIKALMGDDRKQ